MSSVNESEFDKKNRPMFDMRGQIVQHQNNAAGHQFINSTIYTQSRSTVTTEEVVKTAWQVTVGRLIFGLAFAITGTVLFFSVFHQPLTLGVIGEVLLGVILETLGLLLLQQPPRWLGIVLFFWEGLYVCIAEGLMVSPVSWPHILGGEWLCVFAIGIAFISLKSRKFRKWEENMRILRNHVKSTTDSGLRL